MGVGDNWPHFFVLAWTTVLPGLSPSLPASSSLSPPSFLPGNKPQSRAQVLKGAFRVREKVFGLEQRDREGVSVCAISRGVAP
jgi:hypothetical protein